MLRHKRKLISRHQSFFNLKFEKFFYFLRKNLNFNLIRFLYKNYLKERKNYYESRNN